MLENNTNRCYHALKKFFQRKKFFWTLFNYYYSHFEILHIICNSLDKNFFITFYSDVIPGIARLICSGNLVVLYKYVSLFKAFLEKFFLAILLSPYQAFVF